MLDFDIYAPWVYTTKGSPVRCKISEAPFDTMPLGWLANRLADMPRYNNVIDAPELDRHMVMVAKLVYYCGGTVDEIREALIHDVAELFVGDIISPIKQTVPGLADQLQEVEHYILGKFAPDVPLGSPLVKLCDSAIRDTERGFADSHDTPCAKAKDKLCKTLGLSVKNWNSVCRSVVECEDTWLGMVHEYFKEEL